MNILGNILLVLSLITMIGSFMVVIIKENKYLMYAFFIAAIIMAGIGASMLR